MNVTTRKLQTHSPNAKVRHNLNWDDTNDDYEHQQQQQRTRDVRDRDYEA